MSDVAAEITTVAVADIAKINGKDIGDLSKIMGQELTSAAPSIAFVQQKVGTTADGSPDLVVTFDAPVTDGNGVIACLSFPDTAAFVRLPEFQDGGNEPLVDSGATSTVAGAQSFIYYIHNVSGGPILVRYSIDLAVRANLHISEWSGMVNAVPEDTSTANATSSALGVVPATLDPTSLQNLVIGIGAYASNDDDYSSGPSNGFTRLTVTGGTAVFQECAYLIRAADHSAVTSVVTLDEADPWAGCAAAFGGT